MKNALTVPFRFSFTSTIFKTKAILAEAYLGPCQAPVFATRFCLNILGVMHRRVNGI